MEALINVYITFPISYPAGKWKVKTLVSLFQVLEDTIQMEKWESGVIPYAGGMLSCAGMEYG